MESMQFGYRRIPTERSCIYRVSTPLRGINSEAYTPRLVLIGPLHHGMKAQSLRFFYSKSVNTEEIKKLYLAEFSESLQILGMSITSLRRTIEQYEQNIRDCYTECTKWINSKEFVDMILSDSVFILMFSWKTVSRERMKTGDPLLDVISLENDIKRDLMLLENQLPFFILDKLFAPIVPTLFPDFTLHDLVMLLFFSYERRIIHTLQFHHFTDLMWGVHMISLPKQNFTTVRLRPNIENISIPCADQLYSKGVKFEVLEKNFSLNVKFENGCLKIPRLCLSDTNEVTLRNLVALEVCHYPHHAYVCSSYLTFVCFLIDTNKDIDLLVKKGIITNWNGNSSLVAEMVNNKLHRGVPLATCPFYSDILNRVNAYYKSPIKKACSFLKRSLPHFG